MSHFLNEDIEVTEDEQNCQGSRRSKQQNQLWILECWFWKCVRLTRPTPDYDCFGQASVEEAHYPSVQIQLLLSSSFLARRQRVSQCAPIYFTWGWSHAQADGPYVRPWVHLHPVKLEFQIKNFFEYNMAHKIFYSAILPQGGICIRGD